MRAFSPTDRQGYIQSFHSEEYDIAIIGGGITGAGVARDAASRGMKVALIEASDFASGTSSRSSKLIHGGIRYLENLEFGLVFEALSERRILSEMAPHLVHPLRFVLPLYRGGRVGMFMMGLGMWLYDALSLFEAPEMHERLWPTELKSRVPFLEQNNLLGAYVYSDAYMDDDRLVLETLRSAVEQGAHCASYVKAIGGDFHQGELRSLKCEDLEGGQQVSIKAKHFISTVGPWTDEVGSVLVAQWKNIMRPSKGVHLTIAKKRFPLTSAVVMATDNEKRIVFAIPRHEMVIIGTTDTDFKGELAEVSTQREDAEYVLRVVNEYFPGAKITEQDVLSSYAGVRPLVDDGSDTEGKTSREHLIFSDHSRLTFVTGGKYTTYRHMAQEAVETSLGFFPIEDQVRFSRNQTKSPLNSLITAESYERSLAQYRTLAMKWRIPQEIALPLVQRHGLEAEKIVTHYHLLGPGHEPEARMWQAEALFAVQNTQCLHFDDFILRRSPLFLAEADHGQRFFEPILEVMGQALDWDDAKRESERERLRQHFRRELAWRSQLPTF